MTLPDLSERENRRESRMWWVLHPDTQMPTYAEGQDCGNAGYWWFPTVGYSLPSTDMYETEPEATVAALLQAQRDRDAVDDRIRRLLRKG